MCLANSKNKTWSNEAFGAVSLILYTYGHHFEFGDPYQLLSPRKSLHAQMSSMVLGNTRSRGGDTYTGHGVLYTFI